MDFPDVSTFDPEILATPPHAWLGLMGLRQPASLSCGEHHFICWEINIRDILDEQDGGWLATPAERKNSGSGGDFIITPAFPPLWKILSFPHWPKRVL